MVHETFKDKVVVVTGASSGIGRAVACELAKEGAWLALAARDASRLAAVAEECIAYGGKAITVPTDVADEEQCCKLINSCKGAYDRIDMIVNNAGIDVASKLEDLADLHLFKLAMDVNFYGTLYCTYYALPHLKETKGRIVNISSMGGVVAVPYHTSYAASKFAVNGFSDSLRMEVVPLGVSVTVVCPYWVVTEFHERYLDKDGKPKGPSGRKLYTKNMMTAEQCAQIVIKAARARKREVLMGPGKVGWLLRVLFPAVLDKLTYMMFLRPAIRRAQQADKPAQRANQ